jgi:hypothetical protein
MVDMQMGADDDVDFIGPPDVPKIVEEPGIEHVKGRPRTGFGVPDGRLDDQLAIGCLQQERIDAHADLPVADVLGCQPWQRLDIRG